MWVLGEVWVLGEEWVPGEVGVQGEVGVLGKVWVPGEVWLHCSRDPKPRCAQRQSWDLSVPMRNWGWAPAPFWDSSYSDLPVLGGQKRPTFLF